MITNTEAETNCDGLDVLVSGVVEPTVTGWDDDGSAIEGISVSNVLVYVAVLGNNLVRPDAYCFDHTTSIPISWKASLFEALIGEFMRRAERRQDV